MSAGWPTDGHSNDWFKHRTRRFPISSGPIVKQCRPQVDPFTVTIDLPYGRWNHEFRKQIKYRIDGCWVSQLLVAAESRPRPEALLCRQDNHYSSRRRAGRLGRVSIQGFD